MTLTEHALTEEFVRLRRGWGLATPRLRKQVGSELATLCGVVAKDDDRATRRKIEATIARLIVTFPVEEKDIIGIALGMTSAQVQHRYLTDRIGHIADLLKVSDRTARRRIDDAFARLVTTALAEAADGGDHDPTKGWDVARLESLLRLDLGSPEVTEARTIIARRAGLDQILIKFSVPADRVDEAGPGDLHAEIAHGARIVSITRESGRHFGVLLKLPRPLAQDEKHTYSIILRPSAGEVMRHYALVPMVDIDFFRLRVRFDPDRVPETVWRFEHAWPDSVNNPKAYADAALGLDGAGEVVQDFEGLERSYAYGIAWSSVVSAV